MPKRVAGAFHFNTSTMKTLEIELPVTELKAALPGLAKIVGRHRTLPVLGCVKLAQNDAGVITIQANNLDEITTVRLQSPGKGGTGQMLLVLDEVAKIVKSCNGSDDVRFCANKDETSVRFSVAGNLVTRPLTQIDLKEWPAEKVLTEESIDLDESFKQALNEALTCASEDSSRYVLNGACLDIRDKDCHCVVGTDGRSLYSANTFQFHLPESLIVPSRKFLTWPGFVNDGLWKLRMRPAVRVDPADEKADKSKEEPAWFQIDSANWSYVVRAIDGQYPNWKQVCPADTTGWTCIVVTSEAAQLIRQAISLLPGADITNRTIVVAVTRDGLQLRGRGRADRKDTVMSIPDVPISGNPVEVALNRTYLLRGLNFGFNELRICDSLSPVVFKTSNKLMVIMPLRMEGDATSTSPVPVQITPASEKINISPPSENAAAAPPSAAVADNSTETKIQTMQTTTTTTTTPERGNSRANNNGNGEGEETRSSFKTALEHIDRIKTNLRDIISDLGEAVALLKSAEKEQRATSREIDTVRSKLREIQSVKI
jgi:DNA polymerase III sliding clamp (beta) subunit (PCNA family)